MPLDDQALERGASEDGQVAVECRGVVGGDGVAELDGALERGAPEDGQVAVDLLRGVHCHVAVRVVDLGSLKGAQHAQVRMEDCGAVHIYIIAEGRRSGCGEGVERGGVGYDNVAQRERSFEVCCPVDGHVAERDRSLEVGVPRDVEVIEPERPYERCRAVDGQVGQVGGPEDSHIGAERGVCRGVLDVVVSGRQAGVPVRDARDLSHKECVVARGPRLVRHGGNERRVGRHGGDVTTNVHLQAGGLHIVGLHMVAVQVPPYQDVVVGHHLYRGSLKVAVSDADRLVTAARVDDDITDAFRGVVGGADAKTAGVLRIRCHAQFILVEK